MTLSFEAKAADRGPNCAAHSFEAFLSEYHDRANAPEGAAFDLDLTKDESCVLQYGMCIKGTIIEEAAPGYYEPHITYFIHLDVSALERPRLRRVIVLGG